MIFYKLAGTLFIAAAAYYVVKPANEGKIFGKEKRHLQLMASAGQRNLKRERAVRRRELLGKKENLFTRFKRNVEAITELTGTPIERYYRNANIAAAAGFAVGLFLRNPLLSLMLMPVFWLFPFAKLALEVQKHKKMLNDQLIDVLGSINSRFLAEPNFVLAVKKSLATMPPEALPYFKHFVEKVDLNMDIVLALEELDQEIDNAFFHEWIRLAIQAAKGETGLRYTMMGIPQDMSDHKSQYDTFEIEIYEFRRDFAISVAAIPGTLLLMRFSMTTFYGYLTNGIVGKIYLALCVPAVLVLGYLFYRYSRRPDLA